MICRNYTKSLSGIETPPVGATQVTPDSRNYTKSLSGIETLKIQKLKWKSSSRNYTKSLSGIETNENDPDDEEKDAAITLNPYQGLKPWQSPCNSEPIELKCRNYTKSLSGIETIGSVR